MTVPTTVIFNPDGRLVSKSESSSVVSNIGSVFSQVFMEAITFQELLNSKIKKEIELTSVDSGLKETFFPHVLKNGNQILALILTLIPNQNIKASPTSSIFEKPDEKVIKMDKLVQVGQLSAGVAHEIRNPLAGIQANLQVLSQKIPSNDKKQEFIQISLEEISRIEKIIQDLLDFAKPTPIVYSNNSIEVILEKLKNICETKLRKQNVYLKIKYSENIPLFKADEGKIIQVLLNITLNAAQAMPDGGTVTINAKTTEIKKCLEKKLIIEILDEGAGITASHHDKMMQPFFTTKTKGLGLGLWVVKTILDEHGGSIDFKNESPNGLKVSIQLPLISEHKQKDIKIKDLETIKS